MWRPGSRMTAPATTGPARQPRPTSTQPATRWKPQRRRAFSRLLVARTLTIEPLRPLGLLHARRLALQIAQEVQLGAAHARRPDDFHLGDRRRVQREDALDALAERHLAHRE